MLGFGDMGKGIAQVCLMAGYNVVAVDVSDELIKKGLDYNKTGFEKLEAKGKLPEGASTAEMMTRLQVNKDLIEASKEADLVINTSKWLKDMDEINPDDIDKLKEHIEKSHEGKDLHEYQSIINKIDESINNLEQEIKQFIVELEKS